MRTVPAYEALELLESGAAVYGIRVIRIDPHMTIEEFNRFSRYEVAILDPDPDIEAPAHETVEEELAEEESEEAAPEEITEEPEAASPEEVPEEKPAGKKRLDDGIIKEMYMNGVSYTKIAKKFGTTGTTVRAYLVKMGVVTNGERINPERIR